MPNISITRRLIKMYRGLEEAWQGKQIIRDHPHAAPDFMIIGTPKSGTTSLFQYLARHPQIIPPTKKEILFFSTRRKNGLKDYLQYFPLKNKAEGKITFEASPSYIYYPKGLQRIKQLFPTIKLIILLRDPVERAFSQWNFNQKGSPFLQLYPKARDDRPFHQAVKAEIKHSFKAPPLFQYVNRSLYAKHLKKLYQLFDPKQILVLDTAELKNTPVSLLTETAQFLEISNDFKDFVQSAEEQKGLLETEDPKADKTLKSYNVTPYKKTIDPATAQFLRDYFKVEDKAIAQLTGKKFGWMESTKV